MRFMIRPRDLMFLSRNLQQRSGGQLEKGAWLQSAGMYELIMVIPTDSFI